MFLVPAVCTCCLIESLHSTREVGTTLFFTHGKWMLKMPHLVGGRCGTQFLIHLIPKSPLVYIVQIRLRRKGKIKAHLDGSNLNIH